MRVFGGLLASFGRLTQLAARATSQHLRVTWPTFSLQKLSLHLSNISISFPKSWSEHILRVSTFRRKKTKVRQSRLKQKRKKLKRKSIRKQEKRNV